MYLKHIPRVLTPFRKDLLFRGPSEGNAIYLTFDDGPDPEVTPWVLGQLEKYNAKATFFIVGDQAQKHPQLLNDLVSRRHSIANHSQRHLNGWKTDCDTYVKDVLECATHVAGNMFRPPYGRITREQAQALRELGYTNIMWSDLSADFDPTLSVAQCFHFATTKVTPGSIIVFHDSLKCKDRLMELLPMCLEFYARKRFEMRSLR